MSSTISVGGVMTHRVGELHLEQTGRDVEHAFLGIGLLAAHADGVDQVCLATTRGTVDEEGIERTLARMLSDGEADGTWQLVGIALDEVLEGLLRVELGIQLLGRGGIECRWRLVGALRLLDLRRTIALHSGGHVVLGLDRDDTVAQFHAGSEHTCEYLT